VNATNPQVAEPEEAAASWRRWLVLAVMSVGTLIVFIDNTVVNTALPAISTELGASTSTLQWIVDAYVLALVGLLLLGGSLGDRYGRRLWMIIGLIVFGGASVLAALATSSDQLIMARALQGVGAALVLPATLSIITNTFPRGERTKAIAIWTAVGALGIGLGPVLGGYLVDNYGWASVFWLHLPVIAIALVGMAFVPESRDERKLSLDIPGAILGTAGVTALIFGIIQGNELGWTSPQIIAVFAASVGLLGAFAVVELRSEHPMLPLRFFRQKDFSGAVLSIGLIIFAMLVVFFYLTQFFQIVQGRSAFEAGLLIVPASLAMMFGAPLSAVIAKRFGPRINVLAMTAAMISGVLLLTQLTIDSSALLPIAALFVFGFGAGLGMPALTDTVMAAVPERDAGVASAVNDVSREFGGALGIATIGSLIAGLYRSNVEGALPAGVPAELGELVAEGIGVASIVARELPAEIGTALMAAANGAFMDAMTDGFIVSAVVLTSAVLIAFTLIPTSLRETQADFDETGFEPTGDDAPGLEPVPEGGAGPLVPAPIPVRSDGR
jgi:DHA2 family multidrug resistance protein-like MFS transporter